jgi:hypothetical protein
MATSGTYAFNPSVGEIVLAAYARCSVRRTSILAEHMVDARNETNFLLSEWSNRQVNLWTVDLVTQPLTAGTATYSVNASTVMVLDAYIETGSGVSANDRLIFPVSRTEYASFPNKNSQGTPTVFWFDRLVSPTITVWQVPDDSQTYTLKYYRCRQVQDTNLASGETPEIPYRWIDAFTSGLTARLADIYKPDIAERWAIKAERAFNLAATQDVENVAMNIVPALGAYRV